MGRTDEPGAPVELTDPSAFERLAARPPGRRRRATIAIIIAVALAAAAIAIIVRDSGSDDEAGEVDTFAPNVTVGDANLVVLATTFDAQGARNRIPESVVTTLGEVPGVRGAEGVLRTFVPLQTEDGKTLGHGRSTIALSWNGTAGLDLREGRPPATREEVALDVGTLEENGLHVGDEIRGPAAGIPDEGAGDSQSGASISGSSPPDIGSVTIVGAFSVAGGDAGVPGVALSAFDAATLLAIQSPYGSPGFDRADLIVAPGADPAAVASSVAGALPPGVQVVPASQLGSREQLRAELEIQRAFFDLLSLDEATRNATVEGADQATPEARAKSNSVFTRYLDQLVNAEFRVQRVNFLDADHADLVFMTYYGPSPSPVLNQPFDAHAVRIDGVWKVSSSTVCTLTLLGGAPCTPRAGQSAEEITEPPPGWERPSTQLDVVAAFTRFAAPDVTADERVALVENGEGLRPEIEAGVHADAPYAAQASIVISGARSVDDDHAEVFYTLTVPGAAALQTPYPLVGRAVREAGVWKLTSAYACGLSALAGSGCVGPAGAAGPDPSKDVVTPDGATVTTMVGPPAG